MQAVSSGVVLHCAGQIAPKHPLPNFGPTLANSKVVRQVWGLTVLLGITCTRRVISAARNEWVVFVATIRGETGTSATVPSAVSVGVIERGRNESRNSERTTVMATGT